MEEGTIKTAPDREKAKSILKMVETTLEMIDTIDSKKFTSHVVKEYYEVIRELITVILLLDGYKTHGEGAHKKLIEYIEKNYAEFKVHDITLIDDLRIIRNKLQAAQRQTHCNDLRVYGVCASWHAVFGFWQIIRFSRHPHLPDIMEKTNDHAAFFAYFWCESGVQLQKGFGYSYAVFEQSTFPVQVIFCAGWAG
jgi:hypothetical protein